MRVTTLPESVETLIVGGGHTGLAMSGLLSEAGQEHLVVERRERPGGGWQDRWDRFRIVSPNWTTSFPGWRYDGPDPDGFMGRDAIVERVARYAEVIDAPLALGTGVETVTPVDGRFRVRTTRGDLVVRQVVVATGSYHRPRIPSWAASISPRVTQLHSHAYRQPAGLPPGGVLIVGSGQTGVQLAEELFEAGREVVLAVGRAGRLPRRYRGRDVFAWLVQLATTGPAYGLGLPTVDSLPDPNLKFVANPHLSGQGGGHETNLRSLAANGIRLAGRLTSADGEVVRFAGDLAERLAEADAFFDRRLRRPIDELILRAGLEAAPDDRLPVTFEPDGLAELDLVEAGISTIIWATGYALDYGWLDVPILGERGYPRQDRGVTEIPGLFFLGLLWQHTEGSATLLGPTLDAPHLLERMAAPVA